MFLNKPESLPVWDSRQGCPLQLQALVGWWSHYRPEHEHEQVGFWSNDCNMKKMVFNRAIVIWKKTLVKNLTPSNTWNASRISSSAFSDSDWDEISKFVCSNPQTVYNRIFTLYPISKHSMSSVFFVQRESPWGTSCRGTQESQSSQSRPYPPAIIGPSFQELHGSYKLNRVSTSCQISTMAIAPSHLVDHVLYLGLWWVLTKLPHHSAYLITNQVKQASI